MNVVFNKDKTAEINLKISIDKYSNSKLDENYRTLEEWVEPRIACKITEKIKEYKDTNICVAGFDYKLEQNKEDGKFTVEQINKQINLFESEDFEEGLEDEEDEDDEEIEE